MAKGGIPEKATRRRKYDYNSKLRNWRKDRNWNFLGFLALLITGLSLGGMVFYLLLMR